MLYVISWVSTVNFANYSYNYIIPINFLLIATGDQYRFSAMPGISSISSRALLPMWMCGAPLNGYEETRRGQRKTLSVPYNTKHRAWIVLIQPLVRVRAQVHSRQWSPLSETYAVRALAVCVGVWRMRAFETQTPVQVDSSCLAAVTCLALYAWFPSNLCLSPITASCSWEETWSRRSVLHQQRSIRGHTAEEVTSHNLSMVVSNRTMEQISAKNRYGIGYDSSQSRSHHGTCLTMLQAGDAIDRLATCAGHYAGWVK